MLLSADRLVEAENLVAALADTRVKPDRVTAATVLLHNCNRLREADALRWVDRYRVRPSHDRSISWHPCTQLTKGWL